jgi:hypothetical protein
VPILGFGLSVVSVSLIAVAIDGHAIEGRLYAEDPAFLPQTGTVIDWRPAGGAGVRIDHGLALGQVGSSFYDPLLAKVIAHGAASSRAAVSSPRSRTLCCSGSRPTAASSSRCSSIRPFEAGPGGDAEVVDRLGPARKIAQIGAVIGREFSYELSRALTALTDTRLAAALDQLVPSELVSRRGMPQMASYVFKHALVQEASRTITEPVR